ncbi:hypothetical protein BC832DRAFT_361127 [Gaertneriomyces semiglobifer]|nr:hypothetical protein BC832DRAFT_361127 [Gaertneriomyces semiglobifer]
MLEPVGGRRFHVAIVHQTFGTISRVSPEDFYAPDPEDTTFTVHVTLPYAGVYVMHAHFTIHVENLSVNITIQPAESSMYIEAKDGPRGDPVPLKWEQLVTGQIPGANDKLAEPWVYAEREVQIDTSTASPPSGWNRDGTFFVTMSAGSGPIKPELCRTFTLSYFTVDETGNAVEATQFTKLWGADAQIDVFRHDFRYAGRHSVGYRLPSNNTWQATCAPPEDLTKLATNGTLSHKIGFGIYFFEPGKYQALIQTIVNGYVVTNSYFIEVKHPVELAQSGDARSFVAMDTFIRVLVGVVFILIIRLVPPF